ncbi:MAG: N-acetylneuraminate synthase family protein [Elusimicrobiales bacterium]|nr:N-acetylneuraminate synthase family protein [Elusimicrobiales bacterium]
MKDNVFNRLFILELANNHMGDVDHGIAAIREFAKVCKKFPFKFAFKFQYRNLDTFIHPEYKGRKDIKYVARFEETRLSPEQFLRLKAEMAANGFIAVCTPFDEPSVDLVEQHGYDIIKVASCSFTDWPLLERIVKTDRPIILSTAGAELRDIDSVVSFLEHRRKNFAIMHCVGEYPTPKERFELGQIDFLRQRYPGVTVGYSTHEEPDNYDAVRVAIGKGAAIVERHVGLKTAKYDVNKYSSVPEQVEKWLAAAQDAFLMCGVSGRRREIGAKEAEDLRGLRRGVFARTDINPGEKITAANAFFAIPNVPGQVLANDMSKYAVFTASQKIPAGKPVMTAAAEHRNMRAKVLETVSKIRQLVIDSKIALPPKIEFELSHQYGLEKIDRYGATIINCINREYCKKIIIMLPGQENPTHHHKKKEETFQILHGSLWINIEGQDREYQHGEIVVVERGQKHSFRSEHGAVFEEVSTTHYKDDSFYDDQAIMQNKDRKTEMTFWSDWLTKPLR